MKNYITKMQASSRSNLIIFKSTAKVCNPPV